MRLAEDVMRDVRHGVRGLWRSPGFSLAVMLTLAVGIGGNTAVFSVVDQLLLRPLPYPNGDQLVADLRRLATRKARLPSMLADCIDEVRRLATPAPDGEPDMDDIAEGSGPTAQVIDLAALVVPVTLDGEKALDTWIEALRRRLLQLLELGPVRIHGRGGE